MNGWFDWEEIERHNDWGAREKSDAMGRRWDEDVAMWDARWKREEDFTRAQADALDLLPTDTVLDIGCGTGPLTMNIAYRVKKVIAQDFGAGMLERVESNARERGLSNVEVLQGNWHAMEPGRELPICDVAIARWSPAQGNILKMSRCAKRRCYSLMSVAPRFEEPGKTCSGYWCRSTVDEAANTSPRPCARKYGFNVHFNILYDRGANPTISYVENERTAQAASKEELIGKLLPNRTGVKGSGAGLVRMIEEGICEENGIWVYRSVSRIAVLGWDPREVVY